MKTFLKLCSIISIIIATLKLAMMGLLTFNLVVFIIFCGIVILVGNKTLYTVVAALAALVLFIKVYAEGGEIKEKVLLVNILTLAMMCLGIYIMLKGVFGSSNKK